MKHSQAFELMDGTGKIVLPTQVRQALHWEEKTKLEIWINSADDEIILKRHVGSAAFAVPLPA